MEISKRIRHEHAELRSLAQRILNGEFGPGDTITVDAHDLGLSFEK